MVGVAAVAPAGRARVDPVTALGESLALLARLDALLALVETQGRPLALLQIAFDTDDAGDATLQRLAGLLRSAAARQGAPGGAPPTAEAFRIGPSEFALLLPQTGRLRARRLAAALIAEAGDEGFALGVGIGVAERGASDLGALLLAADGALRAVRSRDGLRARLLTRTPADAVGATGVVEWLGRHSAHAARELDRVYQLAMTDPLTGLPNQRVLSQFLQTEVPRAQRHNRPFAILLIDGDNLKEFNTRFGTGAGDEWIRALGALLAAETRGSDLTVRWRVGDEFIVAMPETTRAAAVQAAERIRAAVAGSAADAPIRATVSIGVAAFPDDGTTAEALLARAEAANALAKRLGKNQIAFLLNEPE